jgi:hypothetical protein
MRPKPALRILAALDRIGGFRPAQTGNRDMAGQIEKITSGQHA